MSVENLVAREIEKQIADEISPDELLERLRRIGNLDLGNLTVADLIREGREERTDQIVDAHHYAVIPSVSEGPGRRGARVSFRPPGRVPRSRSG